MAKKDIIAIGGSAGSSAALRQIVADFPDDLSASALITTHVPSNSSAYLADMLAPVSSLPVASAIDGQPIEQGNIYVAVPERHSSHFGVASMHRRKIYKIPFLFRLNRPSSDS